MQTSTPPITPNQIDPAGGTDVSQLTTDQLTYLLHEVLEEVKSRKAQDEIKLMLQNYLFMNYR